MPPLNELWTYLTEVGATPDLWMYPLSWALTLLLITSNSLWRVARNVVTVVHEGGHALVGLLWGRRLKGIKLHADTSGVTISSGKTWGLGMVFTTAAGYTAPALLGLGLQYLSSQGRSLLAILLLSVLLLGVFISVRNFWGFLVTIPLLGLFAYSFVWGTSFQLFLIVFLATFLSGASLRPIIELQRSRKAGEAKDSDADQLARISLIPGIVWVGIFLGVSLGGIALTLWLQLSGVGLGVAVA